jgi:hypothetical protein
MTHTRLALRQLAGVAAALVLAGACHSASNTSTAPSSTAVASTSTRPSASASVPAAAVSTGCGAANAGHATIPWAQLRNPILSYPDTAAKDVGVRLAGGRWYAFFSSIRSGPVHWRIGTTSSADLRSWSRLTVWRDQRGTEGLASPDITQMPNGTYVVTYQSDPGDVGGAAKLYYRTSPDLKRWSDPKPLARTLHPRSTDRMIDGALAYVGGGVILGYKYGSSDGTQKQAFEIAYSPSGSLDGPWTFIGRPSISAFGDTFENYEFLQIDGRWHMVATTNTLDRPYIATLAGDPTQPASWLHWTGGRVLNIPAEAWNSAPGPSGVTHEVANAIYLCDAREIDGHYYAFYMGSNELTQFGGWGHAKIGIARSTDLVHWQVP